MKNRRYDNELRNKISHMRSFLEREFSLQELFDLTLLNVLDLIKAEYGLLTSTDITPQHIIEAHNPICYRRQFDNDGAEFYQTVKLNSVGGWLTRGAKPHITHGKPIYLNGPLGSAEKQSFPDALQPVENALIIPLVSLNTGFAVILLTNKTTGFHMKEVQRIWPLLSYCGLIYRMQSSTLLNQGVLHQMEDSVDELEKLFFVSHDAIIEVDQNHIITKFNPAAEKIFRTPSEVAIGQSLEQFIPSNYQHNHRLKYWEATYWLPENQHKIAAGIDAAGQELTFHYEIYNHQHGQSRHTTYLLHNLTSQLNLKKQNQEILSRLKATTDIAPVGILQVDENWNSIYVNDTWCMLTGMTPQDSEEQGWISAIHPNDINEVLKEMQTTLSHQNEYTGDIRFLNPIGHVSIVHTRIRPLSDLAGKLTGFLATFIDVTALRNTEQKLRNLAERDSLTGLSNRNTFLDKLQNAIDRSRRRGPISLVYLDLDGFKHINDTMGHDAGDNLLKTVAERIKLHTRKEDTVARLGGDEFTLILEAMHDPTYAAEMVNNILKLIAQPIIVDHQSLYISASAGIAIGNYDTEPKQLLRQADTALYKAKALGRNNYQYFTEEMTIAAERRLQLHNELHSAIDRKEFCLFYQPQYDLKKSTIIGTEALLRWNHPHKGVCTPDLFLAMLEESKLIVQLGEWILDRACKQQAYWLKHGILGQNTTISVNISARQFYQFEIVDLVTHALQRSGLSSKNLCLEITESVIMRNVEKCSEELNALKKLGVKVSLDDFGKGYSSLSQLCQLPIDQIKLDQTFVNNLFNDPKTATVSRSVLALGRELGLHVVAEGIDNQEKFTYLLDHGCDSGQGYYFAKPCSAEHLTTLLEDAKKQNIVIPAAAELS